MEYLTQLVTKFIRKPQNPEKYILNRNNKNDYFRTEPIICSNDKYEIDIPGAAGLAPYLMGICKVLQEEFKPELEQSIIVGTSVGSFCSLVLASNIQFDDAYYNGTTKFLQAIGKSLRLLASLEGSLIDQLAKVDLRYPNGVSVQWKDGYKFADRVEQIAAFKLKKDQPVKG